MRKNSIWAVLAAGLLVWTAAFSIAGIDDIKEVDTQDLLKNPQNYWALPVVFKDSLLSLPGGKALRIGDKRYAAFSTTALGTCYSEPALVPRMQIQELNRTYLFVGTVLQKGRRYYTIVRDLQPATLEKSDTLEPGAITKVFTEPITTDPDAPQAPEVEPGFQQVLDLTEESEKALFAYKEENNLSDSVLDENSPHYRRAMQVIRAKIAAMEKDEEKTSRDLLADYIAAVLKSQNPSHEGTAVEEPAAAVSQPPPTSSGVSASDLFAPVMSGWPSEENAPADEPPAEQVEAVLPPPVGSPEEMLPPEPAEPEAVVTEEVPVTEPEPEVIEEPKPQPQMILAPFKLRVSPRTGLRDRSVPPPEPDWKPAQQAPAEPAPARQEPAQVIPSSPASSSDVNSPMMW